MLHRDLSTPLADWAASPFVGCVVVLETLHALVAVRLRKDKQYAPLFVATLLLCSLLW